MNIDDLTLGEIKEISSLINSGATLSPKSNASKIDSILIENYHIFRTYSAGVFFGKLIAKDGDECIVDECRRLYYWKTKGGISLSEVAVSGLGSGSKVCATTTHHWIKAIELIPCTQKAINSIDEQDNYVN